MFLKPPPPSRYLKFPLFFQQNDGQFDVVIQFSNMLFFRDFFLSEFPDFWTKPSFIWTEHFQFFLSLVLRHAASSPAYSDPWMIAVTHTTEDNLATYSQ